MILVVAWRNIWRNKTRSGVIIASVAIGLWAGAFIVSFSWGMYQQHIREVIDSQLSYLQLHEPGFESDREINAIIPSGDSIARSIRREEGVKAVSARLIVSGMFTAPTGVSGV